MCLEVMGSRSLMYIQGSLLMQDLMNTVQQGMQCIDYCSLNQLWRHTSPQHILKSQRECCNSSQVHTLARMTCPLLDNTYLTDNLCRP